MACENPGAVVVNIACGLDTRCYRMEGYAHWYNLDLPETMAVRASPARKWNDFTDRHVCNGGLGRGDQRI